eukprot:93605-Rhodomonas_salina.1
MRRSVSVSVCVYATRDRRSPPSRGSNGGALQLQWRPPPRHLPGKVTPSQIKSTPSHKKSTPRANRKCVKRRGRVFSL